MQRQIEIEVAERAARGKNAARRLRAAGSIPATLYGLGREPRSLAIDTKTMTNILRDPAGHNRVFNLTCNGASQHAMVVDYQIHPVSHSLLHADLRRVDVARPVTVSVPIRSVGAAVGVKNEGGFEEMVSRDLKVECLPLDIPEHIDIDITNLHVGQGIRARDVPPSEAWKLADAEQKLLVHVMASRASGDLEAEEEEEEEEAGEADEG